MRLFIASGSSMNGAVMIWKGNLIAVWLQPTDFELPAVRPMNGTAMIMHGKLHCRWLQPTDF
ncbi:MAG: hypothetical protein BGO48_12355 [Mucilaginibacter sp. 44-25]|nr:MAG: hypothetical protein BGO48_12355 [Mucilaginibacter sp. 44-25]